MKAFFTWAVDKARGGRPFWLNVFFKKALPFNGPHGIRIVEMGNSLVRGFIARSPAQQESSQWNACLRDGDRL